jgi:tRNA dimethylallyltransferase
MLEQGFIDEVVRLRQRGDLDLSLPSMRCVGYRQVWQHLDGELSHQQMIDKSIAATRQLAKRQITWLRKQPPGDAFDCLNYRKDAIFRRVEAAFSQP